MNRFRILLLAVAAVMIASLPWTPVFSQCCAAEDDGWVSLFDGKSLDGWEVKSGYATYAVEDGTIVGTTAEGSPNTFLCTKKQYGDFILEFEVQDDPELNSGVQFRSHAYDKETVIEGDRNGTKFKRTWPAGRVYGYQVEICGAKIGKSGGIYDEARRARWLYEIPEGSPASKAFKDGQWNKYRVECRGDSIKTWINGVPCADMTDSMDKSGFLGLQVHQVKGNPKLQVHWRNLRIQDL